MTKPTPSDRRASARQPAEAMAASVRPKGNLSRQIARVLDFNRSGVAIVTPRELPIEKPLFVNLRLDGLCIDSVIAVAHNSCPCADGYRSGLQFRCDSELQLDGEEIAGLLTLMEERLSAMDDESAGLDSVEASCGSEIAPHLRGPGSGGPSYLAT